MQNVNVKIKNIWQNVLDWWDFEGRAEFTDAIKVAIGVGIMLFFVGGAIILFSL